MPICRSIILFSPISSFKCGDISLQFYNICHFCFLWNPNCFFFNWGAMSGNVQVLLSNSMLKNHPGSVPEIKFSAQYETKISQIQGKYLISCTVFSDHQNSNNFSKKMNQLKAVINLYQFRM